MAKKQYFQESELVFKEKPIYGRFVDIEGQVFGKLTILGFAGLETGSGATWYGKCNCGIIKKFSQGALKKGTKSCGCLVIEKMKQWNTTHGMSRSKTYLIWQGMISRCVNPKTHEYHNYGGRGITICDRWRYSFDNFLADMGERPEGLTLDRKENDKGYYEENCRWATMKEQMNNKRTNRILTFNGVSKNMLQWSEFLGINISALRYRLAAGWIIEKAFTEPVKKRKWQQA